MHHSERRARAVLTRLDAEAPVGAEIGVWRGEMSAHLLRIAPTLMLYMVDPWEDPATQPVSDWTQDQLYRQAVDRTAFAGYRAVVLRMPSVEAATCVGTGSLDFAFIDGDHRYEAVRADIAAWAPKIKPGGLLCGHDYSPPGMRSATGWPGVVRAVDEYVDAEGLTLDRGEEATWFMRVPHG